LAKEAVKELGLVPPLASLSELSAEPGRSLLAAVTAVAVVALDSWRAARWLLVDVAVDSLAAVASESCRGAMSASPLNDTRRGAAAAVRPAPAVRPALLAAPSLKA
jgi:hypothetical protein